jgi:hypothetical protein
MPVPVGFFFFLSRIFPFGKKSFSPRLTGKMVRLTGKFAGPDQPCPGHQDSSKKSRQLHQDELD